MQKTILLALLLMCTSAFAHKDRIEHARTLSIDFRTGEKVVFEITNSMIASLTVHINSSKHTVPPEVCARLRPQEIHFNAVKLLWNGSYKTAAEADYFHIQFMMGPLSTKPYAEFPPVDLHFENGKFSRAQGLFR
jgi:hypothetical protein